VARPVNPANDEQPLQPQPWPGYRSPQTEAWMADPLKDEGDGTIETAAKRLERALALLEGRIQDLAARADGGAAGLFDLDRSQLASQLDVARARERELEAAGAEASHALARAIQGIRSALERTEAN
jgi:Domain of unknown function (DUF4164)